MKNIALIITTLAALMMAGCKQHDTPENTTPCRLEMTLPPAQIAPENTKAAENEIADVWIIQLKGADVVAAEYRTDFQIVGGSLFVDVLLKLGNTELYVMANTHNDALYTGVTTKTDVLAKQLPFDATQAANQLPMTGWMANPDATKLNRLKLTYRVAKISLSVSTTSMAPGASFTTQTIKLCKVPKMLDIDSTATPSPAALAANFGADLTMATAVAQSGVWYMAANKRGVGTATDQLGKTDLTAPAGQGAWCTYVEVFGQYKASAGAAAQPVYYKLWLGDNVVNNYNVRGGSFYNITMSILNVSAADARITVYDDRFDLALAPSDGESDAETAWKAASLNYTNEPSNCYTSYLDAKSKYSSVQFNALKKPRAMYTKGNGTEVKAQGSNPSTAAGDNLLTPDIVWVAGDYLQVSWQTAVDHNASATTQAQMVINDGSYTNHAVVANTIAVPSTGIVKVKVNGPGNAVLSYKRGGVILWNYHIWVTDTNPFVTHAINAGGNVNGTAEGGKQAGFMDRNLGALSSATAKPAAADAYKYFGVLYQHGRSTPFSGQGVGTTVNAYTVIYNGAATKLSSGFIGGYTQSSTAVSSVTDAIKTPNTYYYSSAPGNWTWYGFNDISLWSDYGTNKSIYDPCPYGYRVPINGSWAGFTMVSWGSTSIDGGTVWSSTWWHAAGYRNAGSGVLEGVGNVGYCWSSTRSDSAAYSSYYLLFGYGGYVNPSNYTDRSTGFSIRCVQEGY